jgi:hypothetical protein
MTSARLPSSSSESPLEQPIKPRRLCPTSPPLTPPSYAHPPLQKWFTIPRLHPGPRQKPQEAPRRRAEPQGPSSLTARSLRSTAPTTSLRPSPTATSTPPATPSIAPSASAPMTSKAMTPPAPASTTSARRSGGFFWIVSRRLRTGRRLLSCPPPRGAHAARLASQLALIGAEEEGVAALGRFVDADVGSVGVKEVEAISKMAAAGGAQRLGGWGHRCSAGGGSECRAVRGGANKYF